MHDAFGRRKWAFWLFVCALAAVLVVPSAVLLGALRSYWGFLTGAAPSTIRPLQVGFTDRRGDDRGAPERDLRFVEFRLRAPKAKAVELIGDFNGWRSGTLPLSRAGGGWELMIPLPPGTYRYLFLVDGQPQAEPGARAAAAPDGRPASLRSVL